MHRMLQLRIVNSCKIPSASTAAKTIADRKRIMEQSRMTTVSRFGTDIEKIAKSEIDFAKQLLEEIIPVKVTFEEARIRDAVKRIWESLPVRIEMKSTGSGVDFLHHGMNTTGPEAEAEIEPLISKATAETDDDA